MTEQSITVPKHAGDTRTAAENAEKGFRASQELSDNIQKVLVDLIVLSLVGKQAHWNIVGPNFRDLHLNLDEVVDIARDGSDEFAERLRALHATPDGRPSVVAARTSIEQFPQGEVSTHDAIDLIVAAIETTVATMREVHDAVDAEDPTTSDMLHEYTQKLEQQAWFISSETRAPEKA